MRRIVLALIAALGLSLTTAVPAHALGEVYGWHWAGTVRVYDATPSGSKWKVAQAAREWSAKSGANLAMTSNPAAAQIVVYQDTACGLGCAGVESLTSTGGVVDPGQQCVIHLNSNYASWGVAEEVGAHEMGHCMGLDHTPYDSPSIMWAQTSATKGQYVTKPQPYDYANMQALYGR